jgi:hypothetical protein
LLAEQHVKGHFCQAGMVYGKDCERFPAMVHKHLTGPLTICCQELYDTLPVCMGKFNLRPCPLNQCLRLRELHAQHGKNGKQHHWATVLAFLAVDVDSGVRLLVGGEGEVHYPLEQLGLLDLKVIAEGAPEDFDPHAFRYLGIIECRLQAHDVGYASFGKLVHIGSIPDCTADGESFGYPTVIQPLVIGVRARFQGHPSFLRI